MVVSCWVMANAVNIRIQVRSLNLGKVMIIHVNVSFLPCMVPKWKVTAELSRR